MTHVVFEAGLEIQRFWPSEGIPYMDQGRREGEQSRIETLQ